MKPIFIVPVIFLSSILIVSAQSKTNKFSASVNFGTCLPIGKFAGKNIYDSSTSYAKLGIGAKLIVEYKIHPKFNLLMDLAWQQNATNNDALTTDANKTVNDTTYVAYNIDKWQMAKILVGVSYQIPIKNFKRTFFTSKILAGVMNAWVPKTSLAGVVYSPTLSMITSSFYSEYSFKEIKPTLAYSFGVGVKSYINKSLFVQGNLEYAHATAKIPYGFKFFKPGNPFAPIYGNSNPPIIVASNQPITYYHQQLNTVNFNVGIGIQF